MSTILDVQEEAVSDSGSAAFVPQVPNRLLAVLSSDDRALLLSSMKRVELAQGTVLAESGVAYPHIYFPEGAVVSVVNYMNDGGAVEVGTIGIEGMAGIAEFLEAAPGEGKSLIQVAGSALRIPPRTLLDICEQRPAIRQLLNRFIQAYVAQVGQSAACNRLHGIEQRCARWILMTDDRVGRTSFLPLKHEFLALMLGVRRAGVSLAAGALQDAGLIRYRRGRIYIIDRLELEKASCECYARIRATYDRLLVPA